MEPEVVGIEDVNAEKLRQAVEWFRREAIEAFRPGFHGSVMAELVVKDGEATIRRTVKTTEL